MQPSASCFQSAFEISGKIGCSISARSPSSRIRYNRVKKCEVILVEYYARNNGTRQSLVCPELHLTNNEYT